MKSTTATQRHQRTRRVSIALAGGAALALAVGVGLGTWQVHSHRGRVDTVPTTMARPAAVGTQLLTPQDTISMPTTTNDVPGAGFAGDGRPLGGYAEYLRNRQEPAVAVGATQDTTAQGGPSAPAVGLGFARDGRPMGGYAEWLQYQAP
jgi:hypothetical protein